MVASRGARLNKAPYDGYAFGFRVLLKGQCAPVLKRSKKKIKKE